MRVKYNPITNRFEKTDDETQKIEQTIKTENTKNRQGTVVKYNAMTNKFESVEPTVTLENKEEKESPTKISNQTILDMAEKNQEQKLATFNEKQKKFQNKLNVEYKNVGLPSGNTAQDRAEYQIEGVMERKNDLLEKKDNKDYDGYDHLTFGKSVQQAQGNTLEETEEMQSAKNELNLSNYILNQAKVENEEVNLWDKTLGNATRAFGDLGSFLTVSDRVYIDENGNKFYLPSYNELKQEKVSNSYDSAVGKFLGDSAYNISKIAGSSAINLVAPGVGTAAYWTDMFTDNYTSAINQGYDQKKALLYSTVGTGSEYLTGKLLGSATKGLTGGKSSQLSTLISNTTNKLLKSPKISTLIGNAGSEATEEFIQEYIGNINRLAVLENSTNAQDYFDIFTDEDILKDALYSAGVGALSGGLTNLRDSTGTNVQNNIDVLTEFKAQLQESKNNTTDSKKIETFDKAIKLVDDYLANPFVNEGNISSDLNNVLQNTAQDITTNIQNKPERLNNSAISNQVNTFNLGRNNNVNSNTNNNSFIDSAKKYNIKTSDDTIRSIDRVMSERRINAIFDDTQFKNNNVNALWRINEDGSRAVVFNPNANTQDLMENVAVHELYHDIANQQGNNYLQDLVLNMASTKDGYLKARKALSNEYAKVYDASAPNFNNIVNEEAVASVLGEKLGNQEFINQLTTEKRSVARVIYDAVVSLLNKLNKLTGYKSEKLYWADVKNKFEKAYRSTSIEKNNNTLNSNTKFHISENLSKNIDNVLADINERNPVKLRDYTPDILVKIGIKDLPMYANPSHIRKNILTEEEAKKIGLSVSSKDHYHGLGKETYIEAIDSLDNPRVVFKNKNNKDYLILTIVKDKNNNNIIVPIEIETDTTVNRLSIDINRIKSVYGYNRVDPDLNQYIKYNIKNNSLTKIYEQKKQSTNITSQSAFSVNNISDSNQNVKSDTRYSMQQEKNNTQELDNSSFSFEENLEKYVYPKQVYEAYKYEDKTKITESIDELKKYKETLDSNTDEGWKKNFETNEKIKTLESGFDNVYDYYVEREKSRLREEVQGKYGLGYKLLQEGIKKEEANNQLQKDIESATPHKNSQFQIIQETNPAPEESNYVWIRSPKDIKSFDEVVTDDGESFSWGDFTIEDAKKALHRGTVTVYSSYPIKNGVFVSTSYQQALDYAGGDASKVHSRKVALDSVAWINGDEGQYAKVKINKSNSTKVQSLEERISGDDLLDAQDLIDELKDVNAEVDDNGYVTVYHQTNEDNAKKIRQTGKMFSKEQAVFFSTSREAQQSEGRGTVKLKFKIPVEKLHLDDIFNDNADVRIDLNGKKELDISSYITNDYIRYSEENGAWQEFVKKNFKSEGAGKRLQNLKENTIIMHNSRNNTSKTELNENIQEDVLTIKQRNNTANQSANDKKSNDTQSNNTDEKIAQLLDRRPQRAKKNTEQKINDLIQEVVNKGHYIDELSKKADNPELKFKYDKVLNSTAEGHYSIGVAQTDNNGKKIGKSLIEIWQPVEQAQLVNEFSNYLLHKHNIDRYKQGKPVFGDTITDKISQEEVQKYEQKYPQFKTWSKDINTYNRNNLKNMVDAGLTSAEAEEYYNNTYSNYIRIYRDITGNPPIQMTTNGIKVNSPIKKAKGGNQDILPLKDSMAQQTLEIKNAIRRNQFGLELLNTLKNGEKIDYDGKNYVLKSSDGENAFVNKSDDGKYYFTVYENGTPIKMEIDEGIYQAFEKSKWKDPNLLAPIRKLSKIQRSLLTVNNPLFVLTNFAKDLGDAPLNSKYASKFYPNYLRAWIEIKNKGPMYQQYMALGGSQNTYFDYDKGVIDRNSNKAKVFLEKIKSINEAVEQAPRLAEFISTIEDGKSLTEAMYNAAEITTNFKRGGDLAKFVNRNGANFLNASIQGFDKQIRNFTGQNGAKGYINILLKATLAGVVPSLLNDMLLAGDDDYEELPEYIKDSYFLFKTGDGKFIRIPKGRVTSIFGSVARRFKNQLSGKEDAWDGMINQAINQVAPNNPLEDNIFAPFLAIKNNVSWNGSDIVPTRLQKFEEKYQYDEKTDVISKWLGEKLNYSPKKINYLLDQFSGGIGDVFLPLITPQARQDPISAKFTTDSVLNNKNVSIFYDTVEKFQKKANNDNATDKDILISKYLTSKNMEISELYAERRKIQNSNLNNKEKFDKVREQQEKINNAMKKALEESKNVKIKNNNYAIIGDFKYKKKYDKDTKTYKWEKQRSK